MTANGRLSAKQEALVLALVSGQGIEHAAKTAGVAARTAYRWQRLDAFQAELEQAKAQAFERALAQLKDDVGLALSTLRRNMEADAPPAIQVRAALGWLSNAITLYRVDQIEDAISDIAPLLKEQRLV